jgi:hypothetical protein
VFLRFVFDDSNPACKFGLDAQSGAENLIISEVGVLLKVIVNSEYHLKMWKASSMKYSTIVHTFLLIATLRDTAQARIYQTSDAIITEGM